MEYNTLDVATTEEVYNKMTTETMTAADARELVDGLREALAEAEQIWNDALQRERDERYSAEAEHLLEMGEVEFHTSNPHQNPERPYVLPFGREHAKWNPFDVENGPFGGRAWLANSTALICRRTDEARTRPTRLIFSFGLTLSQDDKIGNQFLARHDQTGEKLGEYEIVGLVFYGPDGNVLRSVGDTPSIKFHMSTYK